MPPVRGDDDGATRYGVYGESRRGGYGVQGFSEINSGVRGESNTSNGVYGSGGVCGVRGESYEGLGVRGESNTSYGVHGRSFQGVGVSGESNTSIGVVGHSDTSYGVAGSSTSGIGVHGYSITGLAALLEGNVTITGTLQKAGGSFKIDHPLDPANKYLSHSFVESPDMKNVYDGVVVLDDKGEADIELPDWFGALNKDFRYQLTAIGAPGPNLYISEEISSDGVVTTTSYYYSNSNSNNNNRFKIAGGTPDMKVSWQVTGIRKDPWANAHRIRVEEGKPAKERGYYIYPELYGQPEEKGISRLLVPEIEKELPLINDKLPRRKIPF